MSDADGYSASFSHKVTFTEYVAPSFPTLPDTAFTIMDGIAWSYTYPAHALGTQSAQMMYALYQVTDASNTLLTALTITIPYNTDDEYPSSLSNVDNAEYQSWRDWRDNDNYAITLSYDGTTSLSSLVSINTLSVKITLKDIHRIGSND